MGTVAITWPQRSAVSRLSFPSCLLPSGWGWKRVPGSIPTRIWVGRARPGQEGSCSGMDVRQHGAIPEPGE